MRAAVLLALAACTGTTGTLTLDLATAPDSQILSQIHRVRLTLSKPSGSFEATRGPDGLDLAFEIESVGENGILSIEGFDASDALIATGQSPPFPLAGNNAHVAIYVAPPYSILEAPARLLPARSQIGAASLIYGAVFAGGLDAAAAPSASMAIYNVYDHTIGYGENMPVYRASVTLAANEAAGVFVLGGTDIAGVATSSLHRFQTNVAPDGFYVDLGMHPGLESAGATSIKLGPDAFLITGPQPAVLTGSALTPYAALTDLPPTATAALTGDGTSVAAFLHDDRVTIANLDGVIADIDIAAGTERAITSGARDTAVVVGGATRDAILVAFTTQAATTVPNVLSVARRAPSVAATARHIVVAGGLDDTGAPIASADILDATTLALLATVPIVPRTHAVALPLVNDQIMLVGGDEPTEIVELFTPPIAD